MRWESHHQTLVTSSTFDPWRCVHSGDIICGWAKTSYYHIGRPTIPPTILGYRFGTRVLTHMTWSHPILVFGTPGATASPDNKCGWLGNPTKMEMGHSPLPPLITGGNVSVPEPGCLFHQRSPRSCTTPHRMWFHIFFFLYPTKPWFNRGLKIKGMGWVIYLNVKMNGDMISSKF